jgi:hypothetical protein
MSQMTDAQRSFERMLEWTIPVECPAAATFLPEAGWEAFLGHHRDLPRPRDARALARAGGLAGPICEGLVRPLQMRWWLGTRSARRQLLVAAVARPGA